MKIFAWGLSLILCSGCATTTETLHKAENEHQESIQVYVGGVNDVLGLAPEHGPEIEVARELARNAEDVAGSPPAGKRLDVEKLVQNDKTERKALESRKREDARNAERIEKAREELRELGEKKEAEDRKWSFMKIIFWSISTFGMAGTVALAVLCPALLPVLIKILGKIILWMVEMTPGLFHFVGIIGKSVLDNVVQGVGEVRGQLKQNPKQTYTAEEVLKILDTQLAVATDRKDKEVIERIRKKLNI